MSTMTSSLGLFRLPNFDCIDLDICNIRRDFSAPPNSAVQSICSAEESRNCNAVKSIQRDGEFQRFGDKKREPFTNPHRQISSQRACVHLACQIPAPQLEFISREIPDPLWNSTYCLERLKILITSPELGSMEERIDEIWRLYVRNSPNGVFLRDLHELSKVIRYLDMGSAELDYARRLLDQIFTHLRMGILVKRMSENNNYDNLRLTLDSFARILKFGKSAICTSVLQLLHSWLEFYAEDCNSSSKVEPLRPKLDDLKIKRNCFVRQWRIGENNRMYQEEVPCQNYKNHLVKNEAIQKSIAGCQVSLRKPPDPIESQLGKSSFFGAFESSILPAVLEQFISGLDADHQYILALTVMRKLCENSYCIRSCVLNSSILDACLLKLGYPDPDQKILCRTLELFYSLFCSEDPNGVKIYVAPTVESFTALLYRFLNLMICEGNPRRSTLRNDVAFIIYLLPLCCPTLRKAFGKYLRDLASILANNILTEQSFEVVLDSTRDDVELIQYLVWIFDLVIPSSSDYFYILEMYQLIPVMVRLIVGPCTLIEEVGPTSADAENVSRAAWKALVSFANIQPALFLQPEGALTMLNTLSAFGTNGGVSLLTIEAFLDVLRHILAQGNSGNESFEPIIPYFAQRNAAAIFCSCLRRLTYDGFSVSLEHILCKVLLCCSEMGKFDEGQKVEFANHKGVKAVIRLVHLLLYPPAQTRHMNPLLHIMVADCIWNCIADCPTGLEMFLLYEGMFRILDLLEIAAGPPAKLHILGAIVDLCDYSRCTDQMMYWRRRIRHTTARHAHGPEFHLPPGRAPKQLRPMLGHGMGEVVDDNDQSLAALFCEIWREEERRIKVLRDEDGAIGSVEFPTMSEFGRNYRRKIKSGRPLPPHSPGPSCLDMVGSVRPRIYLLVKSVTEGSNTEATVFSGLSLKNQVTIQAILNYLDLKRTEIWLEVDAELRSEGLTLVKSDATGLRCMLKICRNKVGAVINTQRYLIQRWREQAAINERELYNLIRNCEVQDHLMALREAQYYATLSNYYLLLDKRLWHESQLNQLYLSTEETSLIKRPEEALPLRPYNLVDGTDGDLEPKRDSLDLGQFGISLDLDSNLDLIPGEPTGCSRERLPSQLRTPLESPLSPEGGFYQVAPAVLFKALTRLLAQQKHWTGKDVDEEREWLMLKKWNVNWYPKANEHL